MVALKGLAELAWNLEENILFTSKLELFSPVKDVKDVVL
jgi:hypothetical protein